MTRYVWDGQGWVVPRETWVKPRIAIISDRMDPLLHPVTGEMLDSKSQFRARTRDSGCVELGNDAPVVTKPPEMAKNQLRNDIRQAISELEAGRPAPVSQRSQGVLRSYDG